MKILFVNYDLEIGGIQKSLVNLLKKMVKENPDYEIDLLLFSREGDYIKDIPKNVKISNANKWLELSVKSFVYLKKHGSFGDMAKKVLSGILLKLLGHHRFYSLIIGKSKTYKGYDKAIAYSQDAYSVMFSKGVNLFVLNRVEAKEKQAYLHADVSREIIDFKHMESIYSRFDKIITVSRACMNILNEKIPSLQSKTTYSYNVFDKEELEELAKEFIPFDKKAEIKYFVTISRLSYAKGTDRILNITESMVNNDVKNFKWIVVGEGLHEYGSENLNKQLKGKGLSEHLCFVGNHKNPYPFVKHCDIFVLPSRAEASPMVIMEAILLGIPIITCHYSTAEETMVGTNNIIVENNEEALREELLKQLIE